MKIFSELVRFFAYITTGIVFVFIAILLIEGGESISVKSLILIPCAAFVTALVTVIFYSKEAVTLKELCIKIALHYLTLCIIMVIFGTAAGWIELDIYGIMTMVIATAAVYVFTFAGAYLSLKSEADKLNRALKSKREKGC